MFHRHYNKTYRQTDCTVDCVLTTPWSLCVCTRWLRWRIWSFVSELEPRHVYTAVDSLLQPHPAASQPVTEKQHVFVKHLCPTTCVHSWGASQPATEKQHVFVKHLCPTTCVHSWGFSVTTPPNCFTTCHRKATCVCETLMPHNMRTQLRILCHNPTQLLHNLSQKSNMCLWNAYAPRHAYTAVDSLSQPRPAASQPVTEKQHVFVKHLCPTTCVHSCGFSVTTPPSCFTTCHRKATCVCETLMPHDMRTQLWILCYNPAQLLHNLSQKSNMCLWNTYAPRHVYTAVDSLLQPRPAASQPVTEKQHVFVKHICPSNNQKCHSHRMRACRELCETLTPQQQPEVPQSPDARLSWALL